MIFFFYFPQLFICKKYFTLCKKLFTFKVVRRGGEEMEINNRLKELRARSNLTQKDLAEKVGVTRQTIITLEKGTYVPSLLLAMNISRSVSGAN